MYRLLAAFLLIAGSAQAQTIIDLRHPTRSAALTEAPDTVLFKGNVVKRKTGDPRVLGSATALENRSGHEYRVKRLSWSLDRGRIRPGETVEGDIGFSILPNHRTVALNSGEEMAVVHDYAVGPSHAPSWTRNAFPLGGFALRDGHQIRFGGVSAFFDGEGGGAVPLDDARLAEAPLMPLDFEVELVRADLVPDPAVTTYRSPYRDRAYVADPSRAVAPRTDFRNTSGRPVAVHGLSVFLSNLTSRLPSAHRVSILVNGTPRFEAALPPHVPGNARAAPPLFLPVSLTLEPGDHVSVRGGIAVDTPLVFDFVGYLMAGEGLTPDGEKLDVLRTDVSGDGFPDILDIDSTGSLWVSAGTPKRPQDTQIEWMRNLPAIDRVSASGPSGLRIEAANGLCMTLVPEPRQGIFRAAYCADSPDAARPDDLWGDFDGDGWPDRLRVDAPSLRYLVALGGAGGLGAETPWIHGYGRVDHLSAWDGDADGRTDLFTQWAENGATVCAVWRSTGTAFERTACPAIGD